MRPLPVRTADPLSSRVKHTTMYPLSFVVCISAQYLSYDSPLLGRMNTPTEITNFDFPLHPQQQILRLDISMYHIMFM